MDVALTDLHVQDGDWLCAAASASHLLRSAIFTYLLLMKSGCCSASASSMDAHLCAVNRGGGRCSLRINIVGGVHIHGSGSVSHHAVKY